MVEKDLQLEREIEQVVLETVATESRSAFLRLIVDTSLGRFAHPRALQSLGDFGVRETHDGRFVEVVDELAVEAVAVDADGLEVALFLHQRRSDARHIILRRLQREEGGACVRLAKTGLFHHQRPEEIDHPPRQTANGRDVDHPAGSDIGMAQRLYVRFRKRPLRREHEHAIRRDVAHQQVEHPRDARRRLPGPGGTFEEGFAVEGSLNDGFLWRR